MTDEKKAKMWYRSKGVQTGMIAIAVAVIGASQSGMSWEGCALAGLGAATIFIRAITNEKIVWRKV